ncbi:MAG TPA: nucleotidyltransferase family protein [Tepidisphaeraceae bacterium]|jgi:hypothetical protein|nr:nucleotidyltransferase family protein [Tepidisphaeraceae bacterium]
MSGTLSYRAFVMAMERIERRLRQVTAALDAAEIPYAVVGGNAVALWVAKADPAATRTTKDVDLLVKRDDLGRINDVMRELGFESQDLRRLVLFIDPEEPSRMSGVHLVWAGEKVKPSYAHPTPLVTESVRDSEGFSVLDLPALLRMKLTSMRDVDRVHVADLLRVGMVDQAMRNALPTDLRSRLEEIELTVNEDE